jgi:hypothetical protein
MVNGTDCVANLHQWERPSERERPLSRFADIEIGEERRLPPRSALLVYLVLALLAWGLLILVGWGLCAVIG